MAHTSTAAHSVFSVFPGHKLWQCNRTATDTAVELDGRWGACVDIPVLLELMLTQTFCCWLGTCWLGFFLLFVHLSTFCFLSFYLPLGGVHKQNAGGKRACSVAWLLAKSFHFLRNTYLISVKGGVLKAIISDTVALKQKIIPDLYSKAEWEKPYSLFEGSRCPLSCGRSRCIIPMNLVSAFPSKLHWLSFFNRLCLWN